MLHLKLARERIAKAYDFLDATTRIEIYGRPSDALVDQIRQMGMGAPIQVQRPHRWVQPPRLNRRLTTPRHNRRSPERPSGRRFEPLTQAAAGLWPLPTRRMLTQNGPHPCTRAGTNAAGSLYRRSSPAMPHPRAISDGHERCPAGQPRSTPRPDQSNAQQDVTAETSPRWRPARWRSAPTCGPADRRAGAGPGASAGCRR